MTEPRRIKRALISVYDKTGIVDFARALHEEFDIELISTGGTAKVLKDAGLPVTLVEDITGFPEMLDGRVKTLHPRIHAAILADRDNPEHMRQLAEQGIEPIDMVVVNLYPFEQTIARPGCTFEEAIEMIDIGGPCLLRAAAKNHRHVLVLHDPRDWENVVRWVREDALTDCGWRSVRRDFAASVFRLVCKYNAAIVHYLRSQDTGLPGSFRALLFHGWDVPRYGENPHQTAEVLVRDSDTPDLPGPHLFHIGRCGASDAVEWSFNNYADASAALELCAELTRAGLRAPLSPAGSANHRTPARQREEVCHRPMAGATRASGAAPASGATPDASAAPAAVTVPAVCFIKHTNACGTAVARPADESREALHAARVAAYRRAYLGDPNAAMGGILAVNFPVDATFAAVVMETYARFGKPLKDAGHPAAPGGFFVEVWLAPCFTQDAVAVIRGTYDPATAQPWPGEPRLEPTPEAPIPKKDWGQRVRLLAVGDLSVEPDPSELDFKRIAGGVLMQTRDLIGLNEEQWRVVTERAPTEQEMNDVRLAWLICKHTKSNAITLCRDGMLLGNGAGQMSRVMSCRIATWLAKENGHEALLKGAVAASDAFFPFRDGPDLLIDAGVTALIQPGGSKRDADTIAACNARGVAMIFTGTRHFRH